MMITWTIMDGNGRDTDPVPDTWQRIRPRMFNGEVDWLPSDGRVERYDVSSLAVKYAVDGGFKTSVKVPGVAVQMYVTDMRVVFVVPDVQPETGLGAWVANSLTGGVAGTVRDLGRSIGGGLGLREKFHLVAQIDHASLALVRYYQTGIWGSRSLFNLAADTGDLAPRVLEFLDTSFARKENIAAVASDIVARAARARARNEFQLISEAKLAQLPSLAFKPSGDAFSCHLADSSVALNRLHELTRVSVVEHGTDGVRVVAGPRANQQTAARTNATAQVPASVRARRLGASFTTDSRELQLATVDDGSLAARAGMLCGDVLVDVAGVPVSDVGSVQAVLNGKRPDEPVQLSWRRVGQPMSATAQM
jgi:PDZ domain